MEILVGLHGRLPEPDRPGVGLALRALAIGRGLAAAGHRISYLTRASDLDLTGPARGPDYDGCAVWGYRDGADLTDLITRLKPDCFVACLPDIINLLNDEIDTPIVADLHSPRPLEFAWQPLDPAIEVLRFVEYLRRADYFLCTNRRQKNFFLSWLVLAGIDVREPPVAIVPLGAPILHASPAGERDAARAVIGGVWWPWQDQRDALKGALAAMDRAGRGAVKFFGGAYPLNEQSAVFSNPYRDLAAHERLSFEPFKTYGGLVAEYKRAGFALAVMARNPERELAMSYRDLDYLSCGLPVVAADYSVLAPWIRRYEAGWVVDADGGAAAVTEAVSEILAHPEETRRRGANALKLAAEQFSPEAIVAGLLPFCAAPRRRERKPALWSELVRIAHDGYLDRSRRVAELEQLRETREQIAELKSEHQGAVRDFQRALRESERELLNVRRNAELEAAKQEAHKAEMAAALKTEIAELRARLDLSNDEKSRLVALEQQLRGDIEHFKRERDRQAEELRRKAADADELKNRLHDKALELDAIKNTPLYRLYKRMLGSGR